MRQYHELPIPPGAQHVDGAIELARIWAAAGKQHVSLATEVWDDPSAWGIMLVDLARHVANTYQHTRGLDPTEVLKRIRAGFDVEWATPTDIPQGGTLEPIS